MKPEIVSRNKMQQAFVLCVMGCLMIVTLLFVCLILAGKGDKLMPVSIGMNVVALCMIWLCRDRFFSSSELKKSGIENRCLCKRTVTVPWEEIEKVELETIRMQTGEERSILKVYRKGSESARKARAGSARGNEYRFRIDEMNQGLLREYLPQRLKDMLSPNAFD